MPQVLLSFLSSSPLFFRASPFFGFARTIPPSLLPVRFDFPSTSGDLRSPWGTSPVSYRTKSRFEFFPPGFFTTPCGLRLVCRLLPASPDTTPRRPNSQTPFPPPCLMHFTLRFMTPNRLLDFPFSLYRLRFVSPHPFLFPLTLFLF